MRRKLTVGSGKAVAATPQMAATDQYKERRGFLAELDADAMLAAQSFPISTTDLIAKAKDFIASDYTTQCTRRSVLAAGLGVFGSTSAVFATPSLENYDPAAYSTLPTAGRQYLPVLLPPLYRRPTYRYDLGRGAWAFEQPLLTGLPGAIATIRTNVVRMGDGSLWVLAPQWPTGELCALLDELGVVAHIVLPTTAWEHAAPVKGFVSRYPKASVWVSPGQNGPFGTCGLTAMSAKQMPYRVDGVLPIGVPSADDFLPPWASEFDFRMVYVDLEGNPGPYSEAAFYHRPTKTLLVIDAFIWMPESEPPILEPYSNKLKSSELGVFSSLDTNTDKSFTDKSLTGLGRPLALSALLDTRAPRSFKQWFKQIETLGPFDRILTAHYASPITASSSDLAAALNNTYAYLDGEKVECSSNREFWNQVNDVIEINKLAAPVALDYRKGCR